MSKGDSDRPPLACLLLLLMTLLVAIGVTTIRPTRPIVWPPAARPC